MSEESSVVVEEKVAKKAGHPGKKGSLQDLFAMSLNGVDSAVCARIAQNIHQMMSGPEMLKIQRQHKTHDVQVILQLQEYLTSELGP